MECPKCGHHFRIYKNPLPTVDIIIEVVGGIVLIERKNKPLGWALPGGFVDYGESLEQAAVREALEETGLAIRLIQQLKTYSDPNRDPRHHTLSTVFIELQMACPMQEMTQPGQTSLPGLTCLPLYLIMLKF